MKCMVLGLALILTTTAAIAASPPHDSITKSVEALRSVLKDPASVRDFKISPLILADRSLPMDRGTWFVCTDFRAKNSFGGYDRFQAYIFFKGEQVSEVRSAPLSKITVNRCGDAVPFKWRP